MGINMTKKRKRSGSIAIPFMIAFLISLIAIGGFAVYMLDYVRNNKLDKGGVTDNGVYIPTAEDNLNLLLIIEPTQKDRNPYTFVFVRGIPSEKKIFILPIPEQTLCNVSNQRNTLKSFLTDMGVVSAIQAVEYAVNTKIDRYLLVKEEAFPLVADVFGGANFLVPTEFEEEVGRGEYYFTGEQLTKLITFPNYRGGENDRVIKTGSILSAMINQSRKSKISETLEDSYIALKPSLDTDIDSSFFYQQIAAARYLLDNSKYPAEFIIPEGTYTAGNQYTFNPDFVESLARKMHYDNP